MPITMPAFKLSEDVVFKTVEDAMKTSLQGFIGEKLTASTKSDLEYTINQTRETITRIASLDPRFINPQSISITSGTDTSFDTFGRSMRFSTPTTTTVQVDNLAGYYQTAGLIPTNSVRVVQEGDSYYVVNGSTDISLSLSYTVPSISYSVDGEVIFNGISYVQDCGWDTSTGSADSAKVFKQRQFKSSIRNNLLVKSGVRFGIKKEESPAEIKARLTLRDMISEAEWRRYISNGFIITKGKHRHYQIFNDGRRIKVYEKGDLIAEICVHSDVSVPKTDHVLNMITLIQFDEDSFYRFGNVSWYGKHAGQNQFSATANLYVGGGGEIVVNQMGSILLGA